LEGESAMLEGTPEDDLEGECAIILE